MVALLGVLLLRLLFSILFLRGLLLLVALLGVLLLRLLSLILVLRGLLPALFFLALLVSVSLSFLGHSHALHLHQHFSQDTRSSESQSMRRSIANSGRRAWSS
ncbi:MAG: hypothetical protein O2924_00940 [Chloroflexi bacterium]|nr:hypothetical protein [Chloroflexota bacterium]